jgi:oxygen-independent coproporphyrinogen-3 oxidase
MDLVTKYNIAAPRYTSYPTVPFWENNLVPSKWEEHVRTSFIANNKEGISLYIHLPFCESLCTYCACNTRITVNHKVENVYIDAVLKEWQLYRTLFNASPRIKEIHLGGGTPTFFSPSNLQRLISGILEDSEVADSHDFSFEGHPNNTTLEHLQVLFKLGFRRVSFGIQDFDEKVQVAINRLQPFENVQNAFKMAREVGYTSINADLVYGLPFQDISSVRDTVEKTIFLKPDRIAFYSYAHVPWLKPGQRKYSEKDLPKDTEKRMLYETGKAMFKEAGYDDIGMDHFALPEDELFKAFTNRALHRNFMGYTTNTTKLLIGLGCSSISDAHTAYSQNIKTVEEYQSTVMSGQLPVSKGHVLSSQDIRVRANILDLMCRHETILYPTEDEYALDVKSRLTEFLLDGLVNLNGQKVIVTQAGLQFLRNICLAFDEKYWYKIPSQQIFSTTS